MTAAAKKIRDGKTGQFVKGHKVPERARRPKGSANKITKDLKNGILEAATNLGRDGKGAGGLVGYLEDLGANHKKAFAQLLCKVLPLQVKTDVAPGAFIGAVNIVAVPSDHYLSRADIDKLAAPGFYDEPALIDVTPEAAE